MTAAATAAAAAVAVTEIGSDVRLIEEAVDAGEDAHGVGDCRRMEEHCSRCRTVQIALLFLLLLLLLMLLCSTGCTDSDGYGR